MRGSAGEGPPRLAGAACARNAGAGGAMCDDLAATHLEASELRISQALWRGREAEAEGRAGQVGGGAPSTSHARDAQRAAGFFERNARHTGDIRAQNAPEP